MADLDEFVNNTDPNNPDTDGDGLSDLDEIETHFTDPLKADGDDDGIPDAFESLVTNIYELSAEGDFDSDGLTDLEEYNGKTMPNKTDTDGDGVNDKNEFTEAQTHWHLTQILTDSVISLKQTLELLCLLAIRDLIQQNLTLTTIHSLTLRRSLR